MKKPPYGGFVLLGDTVIRWHEISNTKDYYPPRPPNKPWRVTRYRTHWYWGYPMGLTYEAFFRWYWQANIVSFVYHHFFGWSCNTWKRKD